MAITIFDLDHTLLNSDKLRNNLAEILGLSVEEYSKHYEENFTNNNLNYSFKKHLEILREDIKYSNNPNLKVAEKVFQEKFSNMDYLLNDGAIDLINLEQEKKNKVILLTFGNLEWQRDKIDRLYSIKEAFGPDNIHYTDKKKGEYLKKIYPQAEKFVIYNDNIKETIDIVNALGREKCTVYIIKSKHSTEEKYIKLAEEYSFELFNNLEEIKKVNSESNSEINLKEKFGNR